MGTLPCEAAIVDGTQVNLMGIEGRGFVEICTGINGESRTTDRGRPRGREWRQVCTSQLLEPDYDVIGK